MKYLVSTVVTGCLAALLTATAAAAPRPNVVVFLVDDMGVMDTSVPFLTDDSGKPRRYPLNDFYRTPSMERLARSGIRFNQFYAMSVCSPTRISIGATVLGAMFGRKAASVGTVGRAGTAMRGMGRASREKGDIARAMDELEAQRTKLVELEREFEREAEAIRDAADPALLELKQVEISPRKSDITVERLALVWTPWIVGADGVAVPADS